LSLLEFAPSSPSVLSFFHCQDFDFDCNNKGTSQWTKKEGKKSQHIQTITSMEIWKEDVEERILSSHHDGASMFEIIFMPPFHS
jgi:hypothetical protein